jgi:hypothetical protein
MTLTNHSESVRLVLMHSHRYQAGVVMVRRSLVRRPVALIGSAVLTAVLAVAGTSAPASAAPVKGFLAVLAVTDIGSGLAAPVQNRPFDVMVTVLDAAGQPTTVSKATTIVLEQVVGPGELSGSTTAVIPRNGSSAIISGATYAPYANGVELRVRSVSGVTLAPDEVTVDVALTAVGRAATPEEPFELSDPTCAAPTSEVPTCGYLSLPNGARGNVTLSLGSCDGIEQTECRAVGDTRALVAMAAADLKDNVGDPLYSKQNPATLIVACDKVLCGGHGVPKLPLLVDLTNTGALEEAPACPAKGVLGENQQACVDYVQSTRYDGDLYSYLLFDYDVRASHP